MSTTTSNKVYEAKVVEIKDNATLIISEKLIKQIKEAHLLVEKDTEWSGVLIIDKVSGDISEPKDLVLKAEEFILMDTGSSAYTEYDMSPEDEYAFDIYSEALVQGKKLAHIHTH